MKFQVHLLTLNELYDLKACDKTMYRLLNGFFLCLSTSSDTNR